MKMENAEIRDWLFALVDGKLSDDEMVKGFIKYYALNGLVIGNVRQDIIFKTVIGRQKYQKPMAELRRALAEYADGEETRTLREVQSIVDAIRAGHQVQVGYYDPEEDDNPYAYKACW